MPSATGLGPVLRDVRGTAGPSPRLRLDPACCSLRTPSPLVERSMVSQFSGAGHPPASLSPTLSPGGTERPPGSLGGSLLLHPSPKFRFRDWGWGCQSVIHPLSISSHFLDVRPWDTTGKLPFSLLGASETPQGRVREPQNHGWEDTGGRLHASPKTCSVSPGDQREGGPALGLCS